MVHSRRAMMAAVVVSMLVAGPWSLPTFAGELKSYIPAHGEVVVLFDGSGLGNFDSFIASKGLNSDPDHVFTVEKDVIHVSGTEMGYPVSYTHLRAHETDSYL